jgi:uncharacterized protein DUF5666
MIRSLRLSALCALLALTAVSSFAQYSPLVGTVIDVDEGRNRIQIEADSQSGSRITVDTDAISTVYQGFGTVIAGKPEIFTGSSGLSNVRLGDRVEIRGSVKSEGVYRADRVILVGRQVPADPVGVGQTRMPTSVSTPVDDRATGMDETARRTVGTIRQINLNEGRIVILTPQRALLTIRASRNTPVRYRGESYRVADLQIGDTISVAGDPRSAQTAEIVARSIELTESAQEPGSPSQNGAVVTVVSGRVTRVETGLDYIYVDDGRNGEIRVDMHQATDANREIIRSRDMKAGDQVEISGSYNRAGDMFLASTVRFGVNTPVRASDIGYPMDDDRLSLVTITGTITETLEDASTLGIRDRSNNRVDRVWVTESFVARTKGGAYVRVDTLQVNDTAVIEAFRDAAGNLIAQSIRLRNR